MSSIPERRRLALERLVREQAGLLDDYRKLMPQSGMLQAHGTSDALQQVFNVLGNFERRLEAIEFGMRILADEKHDPGDFVFERE